MWKRAVATVLSSPGCIAAFVTHCFLGFGEDHFLQRHHHPLPVPNNQINIQYTVLCVSWRMVAEPGFGRMVADIYICIAFLDTEGFKLRSEASPTAGSKKRAVLL